MARRTQDFLGWGDRLVARQIERWGLIGRWVGESKKCDFLYSLLRLLLR
jgi:hypothetical protein